MADKKEIIILVKNQDASKAKGALKIRHVGRKKKIKNMAISKQEN